MRAKWVKRRLGDCGEIISGGTPSTSNPVYWGGAIPFVTPLDLSRNDGAWLVSTIRSITEDGLANSSANLLQKNALVISTRAPIGYLAVTLVPSVTNQGCKSLSLNDDEDALYFYYHLHALVHTMECYGVGTTFSEISKRDLAKLKIIHPSSTDEQRRIAGILSTCDEVIMRSRSAVEKLRKIKAGMLNDFFTRGIDDDGRLRPPPQQAPKLYKDSPLGPIPKEWEVKRLGEIGDVLMCKRVLKEQTDVMGDIPFFKIGTFGRRPDAYISRMLFESLKAQYSYPRKGDVLISAAGTIGRTVVFDGEDAYFQDSNIVWIDNDESQVLNRFLFYCYSIVDWNTEDGGIVNRLYNDNLKEQLIPCPSVSEQDRIASRLSAIDERIATEERVVAKYRSVKAGLMQRLLSPPGDAEVVDETILEAV